MRRRRPWQMEGGKRIENGGGSGLVGFRAEIDGDLFVCLLIWVVT